MKRLVTVLVLVVLAAGGLWIVRTMGGPDIERKEGPMTLYCDTCGKMEQDPEEAEWEGSKFLCPKCNQYTATTQAPSTLPKGLGELP